MPDCLVCVTVKELPRPHVPSVEFACSTCQRQVWVDRKLTLLTTTMRVLCIECAGNPNSWKERVP